MEENKILNLKSLKDKLLKYTNKEVLDSFFKYLYNNFGEGKILPDEHIENIIKKELYILGSPILVEYYIDTYRILELMGQDTNVLINEIEREDLLGYHHNIAKEFKAGSDKFLEKKYEIQISPFNIYSFENEDYKVEPIKTIQELDWEGKYMNHCIATYRFIIAEGEYVGFKFFNKNSWERLTLGCHLRNGKLIFNQLKAHSNYPASDESRKFAIEYCKEMKIECDEDSYDLKF
jgi:hypothetical protein